MKRRLLPVLCLVSILMSLMFFSVSAETSGDCGDNATWSLSSSGVLTISGSGAIRDYIYSGANLWPDIMAPWRDHASDVKKIVISSGITRIGDNAFCCLPNVTSVSIPGTVTVIGQAAFCDNTKLNNVTVPNSVTTIEKSAFKRCSSLSSIKLPTNLVSLGEGAFAECTALKSMTLPSKLTVVQYRTFSKCFALQSITIPEGVTAINTGAFEYCQKLTNIKLPGSLREIAPSAFQDSGLTQITIPKNVTHIMQDAFSGCYSLKRVQFTGNAPSFDSHVFNTIATTAYYPRDNSSWTETVRQDYGGTVTWVAYCGNGHAWGQWETEREATCAKTGLKVRSCTQCDMTEEESIAKTEHQYTSIITPPTCKDNGFTTHTCKVCNDSYSDSETPAGTHVFGEWVVIKASTCLEKGSRQHTCTVCQLQETEETEISDHTYQEKITEATCTQQGFTTHTCSVCEDSFIDTYIEPVAHTFGQWQEIKPATWKEEGQQHRQCVDCTETETEVIPKLPINWGAVIGITAGGVLVIAAVLIAIIIKKRKTTK